MAEFDKIKKDLNFDPKKAGTELRDLFNRVTSGKKLDSAFDWNGVSCDPKNTWIIYDKKGVPKNVSDCSGTGLLVPGVGGGPSLYIASEERTLRANPGRHGTYSRDLNRIFLPVPDDSHTKKLFETVSNAPEAAKAAYLWNPKKPFSPAATDALFVAAVQHERVHSGDGGRQPTPNNIEVPAYFVTLETLAEEGFAERKDKVQLLLFLAGKYPADGYCRELFALRQGKLTEEDRRLVPSEGGTDFRERVKALFARMEYESSRENGGNAAHALKGLASVDDLMKSQWQGFREEVGRLIENEFKGSNPKSSDSSNLNSYRERRLNEFDAFVIGKNASFEIKPLVFVIE